MKKKKIGLIILIIVIVVIVGLLIFLISKSIIDNKDKNISGIQMDDKIDQLVSDGYTYYLLSVGPIPTDGAVVEVDGVEYEYVNIAKIKTIEDITNLVNDLFVEDIRKIKETSIFENRSFLELDNGLYVSYDKDSICDITNISGLRDYTYDKVSNDMYRINTAFGDNNVIYENDDWRIQSDIFRCSNGNINN